MSELTDNGENINVESCGLNDTDMSKWLKAVYKQQQQAQPSFTKSASREFLSSQVFNSGSRKICSLNDLLNEVDKLKQRWDSHKTTLRQMKKQSSTQSLSGSCEYQRDHSAPSADTGVMNMSPLALGSSCDSYKMNQSGDVSGTGAPPRDLAMGRDDERFGSVSPGGLPDGWPQEPHSGIHIEREMPNSEWAAGEEVVEPKTVLVAVRRLPMIVKLMEYETSSERFLRRHHHRTTSSSHSPAVCTDVRPPVVLGPASGEADECVPSPGEEVMSAGIPVQSVPAKPVSNTPSSIRDDGDAPITSAPALVDRKAEDEVVTWEEQFLSTHHPKAFHVSKATDLDVSATGVSANASETGEGSLDPQSAEFRSITNVSNTKSSLTSREQNLNNSSTVTEEYSYSYGDSISREHTSKETSVPTKQYRWKIIRSKFSIDFQEAFSDGGKHRVVLIGDPGVDFSKVSSVRSQQLLFKKRLEVFLKSKNVIPVWLEDEAKNERFAEELLHPLFHFRTPPIGTGFSFLDWPGYVQLNQAFAETIRDIYAEDDWVVVYNFHFLLLPEILRQHQKTRSAMVAFYLPTVFPSSEMYRILPQREELLRGVLHSNLIAFHSHQHKRHFFNACTRVLAVECSNRKIEACSESGGKGVRVATVPQGIPIDPCLSYLASPSVDKAIGILKQKFKGRKVLLGVDPLDYTQGIPQKMMAFRKLLTNHPEWANKLVFVQLCYIGKGPSLYTGSINNSPNIQSELDRKEILTQVFQVTGYINSAFGTVDHLPVHLLVGNFTIQELVPIYAAAHIGVMTALRESLCIPAYYFVICQKNENRGVLVLSEFSASAQLLGAAALSVNPWDITSFSNTLLDALNMADDERIERHEVAYECVTKHDSFTWGRLLLQECQEALHDSLSERVEIPKMLNIGKFISCMENVKHRVLILGLRGCLITNPPDVLDPEIYDEEEACFGEDATSDGRTPMYWMSRFRETLRSGTTYMSAELVSVINKLTGSGNTTVIVLSSSSCPFVQSVLQDCHDVWAIAENGHYLQMPKGNGNFMSYDMFQQLVSSNNVVVVPPGSEQASPNVEEPSALASSSSENSPKIKVAQSPLLYGDGNSVTDGAANLISCGTSVSASSTNNNSNQDHLAWLPAVEEILTYFASRTPGSFIRKTRTAISWHYLHKQREFSSMQAKDLLIHLWAGILTCHEDVDVAVGGNSIEVRSCKVTKSMALEGVLSYVLRDVPYNEVGVLLVGNLLPKDEDVFQVPKMVLSSNGSLKHVSSGMGSENAQERREDTTGSVGDSSTVFTCAIGLRPSKANYRVNASEIYRILKNLEETSSPDKKIQIPAEHMASKPSHITTTTTATRPTTQPHEDQAQQVEDDFVVKSSLLNHDETGDLMDAFVSTDTLPPTNTGESAVDYYKFKSYRDAQITSINKTLKHHHLGYLSPRPMRISSSSSSIEANAASSAQTSGIGNIIDSSGPQPSVTKVELEQYVLGWDKSSDGQRVVVERTQHDASSRTRTVEVETEKNEIEDAEEENDGDEMGEDVDDEEFNVEFDLDTLRKNEAYLALLRRNKMLNLPDGIPYSHARNIGTHTSQSPQGVDDSRTTKDFEGIRKMQISKTQPDLASSTKSEIISTAQPGSIYGDLYLWKINNEVLNAPNTSVIRDTGLFKEKHPLSPQIPLWFQETTTESPEENTSVPEKTSAPMLPPSDHAVAKPRRHVNVLVSGPTKGHRQEGTVAAIDELCKTERQLQLMSEALKDTVLTSANLPQSRAVHDRTHASSPLADEILGLQRRIVSPNQRVTQRNVQSGARHSPKFESR